MVLYILGWSSWLTWRWFNPYWSIFDWQLSCISSIGLVFHLLLLLFFCGLVVRRYSILVCTWCKADFLHYTSCVVSCWNYCGVCSESKICPAFWLFGNGASTDTSFWRLRNYLRKSVFIRRYVMNIYEFWKFIYLLRTIFFNSICDCMGHRF